MKFVEAANYHKGRVEDVRLLVLHTMESPEANTTAEAVARWFAGLSGRAPIASAHWCIDPDSIVQCVKRTDTAFAAPGANADGIQYEMAGRAAQDPGDWGDRASQAILDRTAHRMAIDARDYGIPLRMLTDAQLANGRSPGVTTHDQVTRVFRLSTHRDPGRHFPEDGFLDLTRRHLASLDRASDPSPPARVVPPWPRGLVLGLGSHGARVARVQRRLARRGWDIVVDGTYGPQTAAVIAAFQDEKNLAVDGKVGPRTWEALFIAPVTR